MVAITRFSDVSIAFHRISNRALGTMAAQPDPELSGMTGFPSISCIASRGTKLATIVSAFPFAFSAVSFYSAVLKQANLKVYVTDPLLLHARSLWHLRGDRASRRHCEQRRAR